MVTNRQFVLARRPEGKPTDDDFELVEADVPDPGPRAVLVRTRYLSVDPYMRGRMRAGESYADPWAVGDVLQGAVVGEVVESNHPDFAAGDTVTGNLQWADYAVADGDDLVSVDTGDVSDSAALGVLGMPGCTAYFGVTDVLDPDPGDTVVVSAAAGAVGSVVGQLAKLNGCRVVGIAGSDGKVAHLEDDLGFDAGINYADADVADALAEAAPNGVDGYFDNVGGPITDAVFDHLNVRASVAVCGQIALYNDEGVPTGPRKLHTLVEKRASVEGFLVGDYAPWFAEATERLVGWVQSGDVAFRETVVDGLENAPDAFVGLFEGENVGKQVVRVEAESDA
ncbi:NADPH-dependent curcumin reductase CurA [Halarchaeum solikamskense]|uniref:NADP-dependent oxidoreductase n=1 Tax=Halarchaeum nitratireducens TaxID=489913 RepID=UPI001B3ACB14|nr:NADP-dependent oxidoreductase [Halarchaeum solikamskense]MBP2250893.1 NADPH-dependent curcumin reductase CurA [Halarchaeum solikamskense]